MPALLSILFLTSPKYLMMKDARRQKSIAKFICSVTPFFVFVFVIYNLVPHRGPLSRGCIYQGILSHWEYCFFPYTGYHWDLETHIAGKNSGEVWGHLDFWIIDSTELVWWCWQSKWMFVWLVRKSFIQNHNTAAVIWNTILPTAAKYTSLYN